MTQETTKPTVIKAVHVTRNASYEANPGHYTAKVEIEGEYGDVKLPLSPEVSDALMVFLAPALVKFSNQAVTRLANDIEDNLKQLNAPSNETIDA